MKKGNILRRFTAAVLVIVMLFSCNAVRVLADTIEENQTLAQTYVKEVKMFYGRTEEIARKSCEAEGFTLCPENLMEGTNSVLVAHLGYKTTDDPGDAITDLSLLDMKNSHYEELGSYEEYLDEHISEYSDIAHKVMDLVNEYRTNVHAGSPLALAALDSLNNFCVDKDAAPEGNNLLGNYLLNKADVTFFEKYIQRGSSTIFGEIASLLATATASYNADGSNWATKANTNEAYYSYVKGDSATRNQLDGWHQDTALLMIEKIKEFAKVYNEAKPLYDQYGDTFGYAEALGLDENYTEEELLEADTEGKIAEYANAMLTYGLFDSFVFQEANQTVVTNAALLQSGDGTAAAEPTVVYTETKTVAEYFMEIAADPDITLHPEVLYPFVASMTAGQRTALKLCGLESLARGLKQPENYGAERAQLTAEATQKLKDLGCENGKIWIWDGVDLSIYSKKTVETSEAIEKANSGKELKDSENQAARDAASNRRMILAVADIAIMVVSGTAMILQGVVGGSLWAAGVYVLSYLCIANVLGTVVFTLVGTFLIGFFFASAVAFILSVGYMIYMLLDLAGVFDDYNLVDYGTIPDIVYHVRESDDALYNVRYDAVTSNANRESVYADYEVEFRPVAVGTKEEILDLRLLTLFESSPKVTEKYADMGAFQGYDDRWMALYYTKSPAAGNPIPVTPGESFIKVQFNDYQAPAGYRPLRLMSGALAADVHAVEISQKTGTPMYIFMRKSGEAAEGDAETAEDPKSWESEDTGQYITALRLSHSDDDQDAQNDLRNEGFMNIIDVNLTPYDGYTYIGYKLGSESSALTDIRTSSLGVEKIVFGGASYAKAGPGQRGITPDGMALYTTASTVAGTPITKITVETERLPLGCGAEPVCLFSGGQAVDFKHKWSDNQGVDFSEYFDGLFNTPEFDYGRDDPVDGLYIYFWPKEQFKAQSEDDKPPYVAGFSYFLAVDIDDAANIEFMQNYARENGFELVMKDGSPAEVITGSPALMNPAYHYKDVEGGALGHDWRYNIYHYQHYNMVSNDSDSALINYNIGEYVDEDCDTETRMYFGVSYTYNPYRAITGVAGLIAPYTETTHSIRYTGLTTPAGTMVSSSVSVMGHPITQAGICFAYHNPISMMSALYIYDNTRQRSNLEWLSGGETEVLSHYLLTNGPVEGLQPILRDDLLFVTNENPGSIPGYVPVTDLRTPGDYEHPMNFALDTSNLGSSFLYIYQRNSAGGRAGEEDPNSAVYEKKHYVAAVFCGTGRTPEEAINSLYANAAGAWAKLAAKFPDINAKPLVTEFDEILPVDLADDTPWYTLYMHDTDHCDPSDNEWVRGNEAAFFRWGHENYRQSAAEEEDMHDCAYIGVVRTNFGGDDDSKDAVKPVYGILKYYTNDIGPETLTVDTISMTRAGGPVKSKEGSYYLYYSSNTATAAYSAPITEIDVGSDAFINGYNTCVSCSSSDRVNDKLPGYDRLRMRTDEYMYIHTKFDTKDLPYIEHLYIGIGNSKKEAYADLIGTTNASAATTVNCNYNSFSDKWIAIGYRRTGDASTCVKDVFLYYGDNPPESLTIPGYAAYITKQRRNYVTTWKQYNLTYNLLKHNLTTPVNGKSYNILSLNEGNGGEGLYLYYAKSVKQIAFDASALAELRPIRNMAFGYGDSSPLNAKAEELADVFGSTLYGLKEFSVDAYRDMSWEYVLGVTGSPENFKIDGSNAEPMSLNYGILPLSQSAITHSGDTRIMMYVDRGAKNYSADSAYEVREHASIDNAVSYSKEITVGHLVNVR